MSEEIHRRLSRRRFLKAAAGTLGGLAGYSLLVEPNLPVVERVTVPLLNLPPAFDGFKLAQLSDLHLQPLVGAERLRPAFDAALREKPDAIALLGDYTCFWLKDAAAYTERCAGAAAILKAPQGVFAVFGNHDYPDPPFTPVLEPWRSAGIEPLLEKTVELWRGGERIFLVGLHSALSRPTAPLSQLLRTPPSATRIVLWHEPDRAEETAAAGGALQLSGHTHGGQVRLPGIGPLALPALGRRYAAGLYRVGPRQMPLYVTRGVGVLPPFVRFCCPPEVTILTLRRADAG